MLEPSAGCRFFTGPWATTVLRLFLVVPAEGLTALAARTLGAHLPCRARTLPRSQPLVGDDGNLHQRPRAPEQTKPAVYRRRIRTTPEGMAPYRRRHPGSAPGELCLYQRSWAPAATAGLIPAAPKARAQGTAARSIPSKFLSWRKGVCRDTACSESQSRLEMLLLIYLQELIR